MNDLIVFTALVGVLAALGIALGSRMASFVGRLAGPEDDALDAGHDPADPPTAEEEHRDDA